MRRYLFIPAMLGLGLMLPSLGHAQDKGCAESFRTDNADTAMAICTRVIDAGQASKVDLAVARTNRAILYLAKDDLAAADKDANEALALDPDHASSHVARAAVLVRKDQWDRAFWEASAAIKLDPKADRAYNYRAVVENAFSLIEGVEAVRIGDLIIGKRASWKARALNDLNQAIQLKPDEPSYYMNRAYVLSQAGRDAEAFADTDKIKSLEPQQASSWNASCWIRATVGKDLETALADCDKALAIQPDVASILDSRCLVKFRMGRYPDAITDCSAALKGNAKLAGSLYIRGLALMQTGQRDAGAADVSAAQLVVKDVVRRYAAYGIKAP